MKTTIDILLRNFHHLQQRIAPPSERAWNKQLRRLCRDLDSAKARAKEHHPTPYEAHGASHASCQSFIAQEKH